MAGAVGGVTVAEFRGVVADVTGIECPRFPLSVLRICVSAHILSIFWCQSSTHSQPAEITFCVPDDVFVCVRRTSSPKPL